MGKIRILSEDTANKIAAGEVIERPASVVKELVENSIDANSNKITALIRQGGKNKIIIIDNGSGMDKDDIMLAFERHSTSKISTSADLNKIRTLGFRGEALPSIASVSILTIESRTENNEIGTKLTINGGIIKKVEYVSCPAGTRIDVSNLFFNVPARKKFLKNNSYETSLISNVIINYALAYPDIHFVLEEDSRFQHDYPSVSSINERIYQIYGKSIIENTIPLEYEKNFIKIFGRIGLPNFTKPNRNSIHFFVNKRYVRDRLLMSAFLDSYRIFLKENTFPFIISFIDIPLNLVDVNVHPSKTEIRFFNPNAIYENIKEAVSNALNKYKPVSLFPITKSYPKKHQNNTVILSNKANLNTQSAISKSNAENTDILDHSSLKKDIEIPTDSLIATSLTIIAQYKNSFILAYDNDGLILIDQHVAHERILYNEYKKLLANKNISIQYLLLPIPIEVTPTQKLLINDNLNQLEKLGFILEAFSGNTFLLKGIPSFIKDIELTEMLNKIIDDFQNILSKNSQDEILDKLITSISCHAAIKINTPLNKEKMEYIVNELIKTNLPQRCPHGRPIIMKITDHQIYKAFKR